MAIVCYGGMRDYLPSDAVDNKGLLEVPEPAYVATAVEALGAPRRSVFVALVDGHRASLDTPLHDGAEVVLMPPFSGGAIGRAAVVTVSDGVAGGQRKDLSGDAVTELLQDAGLQVGERVTVADEADAIEACLCELIERGVPLICTTGGTGLGPRDVTPEATKRVVEREAPGIAELIRQAGLVETKHAALSRGVAGATGTTLIVNLPGSPRGATTSLAAVIDVLGHALDLLAGNTHHPKKSGPR